MPGKAEMDEAVRADGRAVFQFDEIDRSPAGDGVGPPVCASVGPTPKQLKRRIL
jgi:hypothetical protein